MPGNMAIFRCLGAPPEEEERIGEKEGKRRGRGGERGRRSQYVDRFSDDKAKAVYILIEVGEEVD